MVCGNASAETAPHRRPIDKSVEIDKTISTETPRPSSARASAHVGRDSGLWRLQGTVAIGGFRGHPSQCLGSAFLIVRRHGRRLTTQEVACRALSLLFYRFKRRSMRLPPHATRRHGCAQPEDARKNKASSAAGKVQGRSHGYQPPGHCPWRRVRASPRLHGCHARCAASPPLPAGPHHTAATVLGKGVRCTPHRCTTGQPPRISATSVTPPRFRSFWIDLHKRRASTMMEAESLKNRQNSGAFFRDPSVPDQRKSR